MRCAEAANLGGRRLGNGGAKVLSEAGKRQIRSGVMNNIFYIIGVIVVILAILGYLGLR